MRHLPLIALPLALPLALIAPAASAQQAKRVPAISRADPAVAASTRTPANLARDRYRHPRETLAFFGVKPTQTIVEFVPGGGWYTEILAPLVKDRGQYIALVPGNPDKTRAMLAAKASVFGAATVATLDAAAGTSTVAPGSADVVLTFRNVHNLLMSGDAGAAAGAFKAFFTALKPGGTLGVVDHRLPEAADAAQEKTSGYVKRSTIVRLAQQAGFRLAGESQVNANAKDTHDHPKGVWSLPPNFALGDTDRAKYAAIGESDRMTLRFVKPE